MAVKREAVTWTRVYYAEKIIAALGKAAKDRRGVFAATLPGSGQMRPIVARMLREMGVPLMATRRGNQSAWFILSLFPKATQERLAEEWRRRIIADGYAEICRMHMAVAPHPYMSEEKKILAAVAVQLGERLGYDLPTVQADMEPSVTDPQILAALRSARS